MSLIDLLPIPITVLGGFFLIKLRSIFVIHPVKTFKRITASLGDRLSRRSLALALAGTLGVGNIVGVAYGISVGGAGSLFWMFASGLFSAVIKYAESSISAEFRDTGRGGMMYVIAMTFKKRGKELAIIYSILCLALSLVMGAALQAESALSAAREGVGVSPGVFIAFFGIIVVFVILKGGKCIENITSVIIPISTLVYIVICIAIIFMNISSLPRVIGEILSSAFNLRGAAGGGVAYISVRAMREGFARGLLSNEAGAGTSAMAQSRSVSRSSRDIGLLGACEVFFDTTLLCTLTGLAVLLSGAATVGSGIEIIVSAVSRLLGGSASVIVFLLITFFAYSTVVCWYFYGSECVYYLTRRNHSKIYTVLFVLAVLLGPFLGERLLIVISDYLLFFMTLITLSVLLKNSERIYTLSEFNDFN